MEAMVTHNTEKPISWNWHHTSAHLLHRFMQILLRDIIPTLAMTALVAWGALIVTEQIHQAKLSRSSGMVDIFQGKVYISNISLPMNMRFGQRENE